MFENLTLQEKKILYPIIGIIVLILLVVLVIIWWPKNTKIMDNINKIDIDGDYSDIQIEKYENILNDYLLESSFSKLYSKIDPSWLTENGLSSEEDTKNYLFKNYYISNSSPNIIDNEVFSSDDMYIFKFSIENGGNKKNIYINETSPYQYTISFEEYGINALSNKKYYYTIDNVEYNVKTEYVSDSLLQYEVEAKNNGKDTFSWAMKNINQVFLVLSTGEEIVATDVTSFGLSSVDLKPGGNITFKVTFTIPLEKQSTITGIKFTNTYKNDYDNDIEILLNGGVE